MSVYGMFYQINSMISPQFLFRKILKGLLNR